MEELLKSTVIEGVSDPFHQGIVEIKVMYNAESHSKHLSCLKEVPYIRSAVRFTYGAVTAYIDRAFILKELFVREIKLSLPRKEVSVTRVPGRHYTVE